MRTARRRRRPLPVLLAATAVSIAAAAPAPAAAATFPCRASSMASGNQILEATGQSVIYRDARSKQPIACSYRYKRRVRLQALVCCQFERYALGSRYIGFSFRSDAADAEYDDVGVIDLKTGKRIRYGPGGNVSSIGTGAYVRALAVTPKGTLAWSVENPDFDPTDPTAGDVSIYSVTRGATTTTRHDNGKAGTIDPGSLAVNAAGTKLFWDTTGGPRSAPLG
jgi:hypothetical protein